MFRKVEEHFRNARNKRRELYRMDARQAGVAASHCRHRAKRLYRQFLQTDDLKFYRAWEFEEEAASQMESIEDYFRRKLRFRDRSKVRPYFAHA